MGKVICFHQLPVRTAGSRERVPRRVHCGSVLVTGTNRNYWSPEGTRVKSQRQEAELLRSIKSLPSRLFWGLFGIVRNAWKIQILAFLGSSRAGQAELVVGVTAEPPELMTKGFEESFFLRRYFVWFSTAHPVLTHIVPCAGFQALKSF